MDSVSKPSRNDYLDVIRAVCAILVLWQHSVQSGDLGVLGVYIFFSLSGFLITTLLVAEERAVGSIDMRSFYVKRVLRIWPAYYMLLAVGTIGYLMNASNQPRRADYFFFELPQLLTFTYNIRTHIFDMPFSHLWSLAVEEQFYLLVPVFLLVVRRTDLRLIGLFFLIAINIWAGSSPGVLPESSFLFLVQKMIAAPICLGSAVAILLGSDRKLSSLLRVLGLSAMTLLCIAYNSSHSFLFDLAWTLSTLVIAATYYVGNNSYISFVLKRIGKTWIIQAASWLGRRSYGFYLLHVIGLSVANRLLKNSPAVCRFLLAGICTCILSEVLFRLVEAPCQRLRSHWLANNRAGLACQLSNALVAIGVALYFLGGNPFFDYRRIASLPINVTGSLTPLPQKLTTPDGPTDGFSP